MISGLKGETLVDSGSGDTLEDPSIAEIDGSFVVWERGDDFIVIVGILANSRTLSNAVTVSRTMPNMDFIIENDNRLWGCRYGLAVNGEVVNELYACKLGDFKNWSCYMGISTDSYTVSLGSDGQFTGAITHAGYPIFFKENCMHKVYGQIPSNFQVQTIPVDIWVDYKERTKGIENDKDGSGKPIAYSAVQKIMREIDQLPISASQKDAIARSNGWADSTIQKYKLW